MAEIKDLLQRSRLITLTGSGGTGKTRLALQASAELLEQYPDGVWLVELAPIADPALVPQTVAQALSIREAPGEPITQTLLSAVKDKQMLLVLDNCEHLLDDSARLVDALLKSCPKLKVLVSSREGLGVTGEQTYRVPSLSLPDSDDPAIPERIGQYESVRLFVDRAILSKSDFALTSNNAAALASACRRLDGIPLAIELAAARVRSLPIEEINNRLDQRFRLLTGGSRTALPRQQTLRAMIDWSYDLLNVQEKTLLHRLSVFAGGWTLEAAEAVCADKAVGSSSPSVLANRSAGEGTRLSVVETLSNGSLFPTAYCLLPDEVLDLLTSLVDKSLAVYDERHGTARYRLLETVRQYARDRLVEGGEGDAIRGRHVEDFLVIAEEAEPNLEGARQSEWLRRLEDEHDNLRAALEWSVQARERANEGTEGTEGTADVFSTAYSRRLTALRLCGALKRFWETRSHLAEGRQWCSLALEMVESQERTRERAEALCGAGWLARCQGDYTSACAYNDESLAIRREIGDRGGIAMSLNDLGLMAVEQCDNVSALAYHAESLAIRREIGDGVGIADSLCNLGVIAHYQGDYTSALVYYEEGLAIYREIGISERIAMSLSNLGEIAEIQGDYARARSYFEQSLAIRSEIGSLYGITNLVSRFAFLASKLGRTELAATLWGAAEALREGLGHPLPPSERVEYDHVVADARLALGDEAFAAAWTKGRSLTMEEAVALALGEVGTL
jgi:non-specific serine/threonine protein kinase